MQEEKHLGESHRHLDVQTGTLSGCVDHECPIIWMLNSGGKRNRQLGSIWSMGTEGMHTYGHPCISGCCPDGWMDGWSLSICLLVVRYHSPPRTIWVRCFLSGRDTAEVRGPCHPPGMGTLPPTWHVDHAAVAVLHDVAGLTVNPTGGDAVNGKEVEPHL